MAKMFPRAFSDLYRVGAQIGEGQSSRVYACRRRGVGGVGGGVGGGGGGGGRDLVLCGRGPLPLCVKRLSPGLHRTWATEVSALRRLAAAGVVGCPVLVDALLDEDTGASVLVMQRLVGSELFSHVASGDPLLESQCRAAFQRVFQTLEACELLGIAHMDVKLENIVLATPGDFSSATLIDFGGCTGAASTTTSTAVVSGGGTVEYMAPEKFDAGQHCGPKCDVWSAGITLFVCLCGRFPSDLHPQAITFPGVAFEAVSSEAVELLRSVLQVDPARRPSATRCLQHPFFRPPAASPLATAAAPLELDGLFFGGSPTCAAFIDVMTPSPPPKHPSP